MEKLKKISKFPSFIFTFLLGISVVVPLVLTSCRQNAQHVDEENNEGDNVQPDPDPLPDDNLTTNYIGNADGTNWKGYETGSLVCEAYDCDNDEELDSALIRKGNQYYCANNLVIPDFVQINENIYPLKKISEDAFLWSNSNKIEGTLIINDKIIDIDSYAFYGQKYINEIIIGENVEEISNYTFAYSQATNIIFNNTKLIEIAEYAFLLNHFSNLNLNNVKTLKNSCFERSTYLKKVSFSNLLTNIFDVPFSLGSLEKCDIDEIILSDFPNDLTAYINGWSNEAFSLVRDIGTIKSINCLATDQQLLDLLKSKGLPEKWIIAS